MAERANQAKGEQAAAADAAPGRAQPGSAAPGLGDLLRHATDGSLAGAERAHEQQRLLRALQRSAGNAAVNRLLRQIAPPALAEPGAARLAREPAGGFLVADGATAARGQMTVGDFLDALEPPLRATAEAGLGSDSIGCPWIEHWIAYYRGRSPGEIQDAVARYAPDAGQAASPTEAIAAIRDRVADGIATWKGTGELSSAGSSVAFKLDTAEAGAQAPQSDPLAVAERLGPGRPLESGVRSRMADALGADFGAVRVHDDPGAATLTRSLGARAMTIGGHVAFAPNQYEPGTPIGDALIAHELAHVVQQRGGPGPVASPSTALLEADADSAAATAMGVLHGGTPAGRGLRRALRTGLRLQACRTSPATAKDAGPTDAGPVKDAGPTDAGAKDAGPVYGPTPAAPIFDAAAAGSQAAAHAVLAVDAKLTDADRRKQFEIAYKAGLLGPVLKALGAEEASFTFREQVLELLEWVQEEETRAFSGKSDADMAKAQAKWQYAKNKAAAAAAAKKAGKKTPVTDIEIEKQRTDEESAHSFSHPMAKTRWDAMAAIPGEQAKWNTRATKAIADMVAYANAHHPETKVTAASLVWDPNAIDSNAPGAFAQGRSMGTATVGFEFVEAVEVNPAYAMSTVVHELYGHPEYDSPSGNYNARLAAQAIGLMPGATSTGSEETSYGYHETEIYSLMREYPYWTKASPADAKAHADVDRMNYDPAKVGIRRQLGEILQEWEPSLAAAIIHGLYKRYQMDPRITKMSLDAFSAEVKRRLPKADAKILK